MPSKPKFFVQKSFAFLLVSLFTSVAFAFESHYEDKIADTPNLLQTDSEIALPENGDEFCAPVSVSNSLMWLAAHGYPQLRPETVKTNGDIYDKILQISMVKSLAEFMDTNTKNGTNVIKVMNGIDSYLTRSKLKYEEFAYRGWRPTPKNFPAKSEFPDLASLKQAVLSPRGAAWLNIGWYKFNHKKQIYQRDGGHWVTVVGYRDDTVIIHDPSPMSDRTNKNPTIDLNKITSGMLTGDSKNLPRSANGYYQISGPTFDRNRLGKKGVAILDGFITLILKAI